MADASQNKPKKEFAYAMVGTAAFLAIVLLIGISAFLRPADKHVAPVAAVEETTEEAAVAEEATAEPEAEATATEAAPAEAAADMPADEATATAEADADTAAEATETQPATAEAAPAEAEATAETTETAQ
ncbi:hypothetical protein [Psychrobacter phenylpyruvicus]|uniref:Uncharacterized protein n=1 Tax=Psychrobacter phenylpyruvicus TaxID=29432 RepID=A0A379LNI8_9GAMM|nr:hypothetical protein [Psychrobacter phenylpyruvicus]SUD89711.1 Uncharacterised protein [Psychrobacter phenylpyruvicus]SUD92156.1 Uncharacterised protein [Psychrobacter phenylpyruvicus]